MEYKLIRSKRKTIELSIDDDFIPFVKAPLKMSTEDIEKFVSKHEKWIEKHILKKQSATHQIIISSCMNNGNIFLRYILPNKCRKRKDIITR